MKHLARTVILFAALNGLVGCVTAGPVSGMIYSDVQGPVAATSNPRGTMHGEACATSWLGLVAQGDASISTAARNGRITQISYVEQHTHGVVLYTKYCTEVWGFAAAGRPSAPTAVATPATGHPVAPASL